MVQRVARGEVPTHPISWMDEWGFWTLGDWNTDHFRQYVIASDRGQREIEMRVKGERCWCWMLEKIMDNEMFLRRGRGRAQKLQKMNDIFNKTCGKKAGRYGRAPFNAP